MSSLKQRTQVYKRIHLNRKPVIGWIGDSICDRTVDLSAPATPRRTFLRAIDCIIINEATGGSNIADVPGGDPTWDPFSITTRSASGATNYLPVENFDLLICWAGFNDKGDDIPIGTLNSTNEETISGAMNIAIDNFRSRNPHMKILWVTPNSNPISGTTPNGAGLTLEDYRNGIVAVCENKEITYYDLFNNDGITAENAATTLPDNIHPSTERLTQYASDLASYVLANDLI